MIDATCRVHPSLTLCRHIQIYFERKLDIKYTVLEYNKQIFGRINEHVEFEESVRKAT
jgi:hypothetical protein